MKNFVVRFDKFQNDCKNKMNEKEIKYKRLMNKFEENCNRFLKIKKEVFEIEK